MNKNLVISETVIIHSSLEEIWEALTNPEKIKQYFQGAETECAWQVGSPIYFRGIFQGEAYEDKGKIIDIEYGKRLVYDNLSSWLKLEDKAENYSIIDMELTQEETGISLILTHTGFIDEQNRIESIDGWRYALAMIKSLAETDKSFNN